MALIKRMVVGEELIFDLTGRITEAKEIRIVLDEVPNRKQAILRITADRSIYIPITHKKRQGVISVHPEE